MTDPTAGAGDGDTDTGGPSTDAAIELRVPPELAIDPAAARRLAEQLAASPPDVLAVAAPLRAVPPGSSARTEAEWAAVDAPARLRLSPERTVTGAVAVRPGARHQVAGRTVTVAEGTLLVDEGSCCYDPYDPTASAPPADAAGARARPPFRWRPVVLLLAGAEDVAAPERLRDLANGLVAHDVEARLAVGQAVPGPHLTRPCAPTEASWRALRPDLVVLVDEQAGARADDWCQGRGTVFVALDADRGDGIELVSWTIGQAQGRLRARIGPEVAPAALARLVNRLCAGPQPGPPPDPPDERAPLAADDREGRDQDLVDGPDDARDSAAAVASPRRRRGPRRPAVRVAVVDAGAGRRTPLADQLEARGHPVRRLPLELSGAGGADDVDLLVLDRRVDPADLQRWRDQARPGSRAVLELTDPTPDAADPSTAPDPAEAGNATDAGHGSERDGLGLLDDPSRELGRLAGQVVVSDPVAGARWRRLGVRVLVAPALLDPERVDALTVAADRRRAEAAPLLGWWRGPRSAQASAPDGRDPDDATEAAIRAALASFVGRYPEARVEVVDLAGRGSPADPDPDPHLIIRSGPPDAGWLAAWTAQIWSPAVEPHGSPIVLEASFAGVPTLSSVLTEGIDPELVVDPATSEVAWEAALEAVTEERTRARWSARARVRAEALRGADAAAMAVDRFLGWALAEARR